MKKQNRNLLLIIFVVIFVVGVGFAWQRSRNQANEISKNMPIVPVDPKNIIKTEKIVSTIDPSAPTSSAGELKKFTLIEIAKHSTPLDCYLAIGVRVYDVSKYIASGLHPGEEAILKGCGLDATELFANRRRAGDDHKQNAYSMLAEYEIGEVK